MQIAEQVVKNGMSAGTAFMDELTRLVSTEGITRIIETGTYLGLGTTAAILKGIEGHQNRPVSFVSIEVNPYNAETAKRNCKGKPVTILNGLSIPKSLLPKRDMTFEGFSDDTIVDHFPHNRAELYYKETGYQVPDRQLDLAMLLTSHYPQLVVLDSAGHVGTIEFDYFMNMAKGKMFIALDDTNHIKHSKTVEKIEADHRFTLTFSTDEKFGSRIYSLQSDRSHKPMDE